MYCPHCAKHLQEGLIMCFHCGEALDIPPLPEPDPVPVYEPAPAPAPPVKRFCMECSAELPQRVGRLNKAPGMNTQPTPVIRVLRSKSTDIRATFQPVR